MSHFTTLDTQIKDLACLQETLEEMGFTCEQGSETVKVRGWQGNLTAAELVVRTGLNYDLGITRNAEGNYEFTADWQMVEPALQQAPEVFVREVTRRYTYNKVLKEVRARGYELAEEQTREDQSIRLRVQRWAT
jgi:hypothetical protein